jgi:hypothetical protein
VGRLFDKGVYGAQRRSGLFEDEILEFEHGVLISNLMVSLEEAQHNAKLAQCIGKLGLCVSLPALAALHRRDGASGARTLVVSGAGGRIRPVDSLADPGASLLNGWPTIQQMASCDFDTYACVSEWNDEHRRLVLFRL